MNSKIYSGYVTHSRVLPVKHHFQYPLCFFAIDLDELSALHSKIKSFSYNRFNLLSLWDRDYLERGELPLKTKLVRLLEKEGIPAPARIVLAACPRLLGYVFNPVSFFYCYDHEGKIGCVIAEVHNTFGESHLYVLRDPVEIKEGLLRYASAKDFHVSPFFDRKGVYEFRLSPPEAFIDIRIDLKKEEGPAILTRLWGDAADLTAANVFKGLMKYSMDILLIMPRIHLQAARLYFQKKLPVYSKPAASSGRTVRKKCSPVQKICMDLVLNFLSGIREGTLELVLPEGEKKRLGSTAPAASMLIHDYKFFWRIARDAGIGLGESYMEGEWDTPDLPALLNLFIANKKHFEEKTSSLSWIGEAANRLLHLGRKNSVRNSRRNIREHYDLGNEMYRLFLDKSMTYSSAVFSRSGEPLEAAQDRKLQKIINKAQIHAGCRVLEIGCGWGAFAIKAAKETGCRVTGITLSEEQLAYARERVREEGLEDRIEILLCDYRKLEGTFDRIVSIEMLEAVGHEYLGTFFESCDRLLKPDGLAVLQVITIPDQRYESYRKSCDWIQKHIFPGGHLPSLGALVDAMTKNSHFFVENAENIGFHYAETLRRWRSNFLAEKEQILKLGFTEKRFRAWDYYFSYCEAGFAARYINTMQLVLTRAANPSLNEKDALIYGKAGDIREKLHPELI